MSSSRHLHALRRASFRYCVQVRGMLERLAIVILQYLCRYLYSIDRSINQCEGVVRVKICSASSERFLFMSSERFLFANSNKKMTFSGPLPVIRAVLDATTGIQGLEQRANI